MNALSNDLRIARLHLQSEQDALRSIQDIRHREQHETTMLLSGLKKENELAKAESTHLKLAVRDLTADLKVRDNELASQRDALATMLPMKRRFVEVSQEHTFVRNILSQYLTFLKNGKDDEASTVLRALERFCHSQNESQ